MAHLVLVRHAQSEWNALGRWQGWADPPLSALGEEQARRAGERLWQAGPVPDVVVSSDLLRASATAALVAGRASPEAPRSVDAGLREYRVGAWSGLTRSEIERGWPGALARYDRGDLEAPPEAEDRSEFDARLLRAVREAAHGTPPGGTTLVVSHGGSIRAIARLLGGPVDRVGNLAGLILGTEPELGVVGPVDLLDPAFGV